MSVRSLVLRAAGSNCDEETVVALERSGSAVDLLHINQVLDRPESVGEYDILIFPGGFTFGDDVASGAVFAYLLKQRLLEPIQQFIADGKLVLGICNGFQILVRLGLLPGGPGRAALVENLSGRFEDRWVRLRSGTGGGPWFEPDTEYWMPVAHAEGRFEWFPELAGAPFPANQIALQYVGETTPARYPANPNGAHLDIAGVTSAEGNVLGLMPHPERFLLATQYPAWSRYRGNDGAPPVEQDLPVPLGLDMYRRAVQSRR